ncbi:unnamed protein product, partial [Cyprideis torosa]
MCDAGKLVVLGSVNADHVLQVSDFPQPGETVLGHGYRVVPGGKGANQAVAAARLGASVAFVACLGDDDFGLGQRKSFAQEGIDTSAVMAVKGCATGVALITVSSAGENCIAISAEANAHLTPDQISSHLSLLGDASFVLMQLETPLETIELAAQQARAGGAQVILNPAPARQLPDALLEHLFMIVPNETEARYLTGQKIENEHDAERAASLLHDRGVEVVLLTLGRHGAFLSRDGRALRIPGFAVAAVDTTAAGDTFCGALVTALQEGRDMVEAVQFAHGAAALSVTRMGAQSSIPLRQEVEDFLLDQAKYSNTCLPLGITGVVADPHEIANVSGRAGIEFILESARQVPMDIHVMLPSCVPATAFENGGSVLRAQDLRPLYQEKGVIGLAEVMDYPAVFKADADMLQKLEDAEMAGCRIDGHGSGFDLAQLNAYAAAGIRTDHECDSAQGLIDRVRRGIYTLVREGTVCRDLLSLLPAIDEKNSRMLCFATDDKHLDDLHVNGGVDNNVRLAIAHGINPATAIQMASLNAAQCYGLKNIGAIAPGYRADFSIVSDLENLSFEKVFKNGALVAENGRILDPVRPDICPPGRGLLSSVRIPSVSV